MRHYEGNPSGDYMKTFAYGDERWALAFMDSQQGFVNVKLYAIGRVPYKANYWTSYVRSDKRLINRRETKLLRKNRPELYVQVEAYLKEFYDNSRTN